MALLQALMRSEDVIKVYEARLTEKETTSLDPAEVEEYMDTLKVYIYICKTMSKCIFELAVLFCFQTRNFRADIWLSSGAKRCVSLGPSRVSKAHESGAGDEVQHDGEVGDRVEQLCRIQQP